MQRVRRPKACYLAAALLALGAGACRSVESRLPSERTIPELNALLVAHEALPQDTADVLLSNRVRGQPLKVAVHETGTGDKERLLVMLHGVMSDHRVWRYMAGALGGDYDVWAIDMPGCGQSSAPEAHLLEPDAYSPQWLARMVLHALRDRLDSRSVQPKITLVGHSLGGGVVLRMLGADEFRSEFANVLSLVDGAVLLAPLHFGFNEADPMLVEMAQLSDLKKMLGTATGALRRAVAEAIYDSGVYPNRVPIEEFDHVYDVLTSQQRWHAAQTMLKQAKSFDESGRFLHERALRLVSDYDKVEVPCLILWGEQDDTLSSHSGDNLVHCLPSSWVRTIRECKHCLPTEEPRVCADQVRRFLTEDREGWGEHDKLDRPPPPGGHAQLEQQALRDSQRDRIVRGRREPIVDAPSTVTVLRGRDLERSGARYLSDALRLVPGIEVRRQSSTESSVSFRGYAASSAAAQGTLALLDGRQVQNRFLGTVFWDQLPVRLEDIEQVEVIRGPGSFLHGPDAMHGVVSIETRSPLDYPKSTVSSSASFGNLESTVIGTTVVHRTENTGFRATMQWDDIGSFVEQVIGAPEVGRDKLFFDLAYEARLDGDPGHVLEFGGGVVEQQFDLLIVPLPGIAVSRLDNRASEGYAQLAYRRGDEARGLFELRGGWNSFDSDSVPSSLYQPFSIKTDSFDLDARAIARGNSHTLTAGAGYRLTTSGTRDFDVTEGDHDLHEGWLFAQDDIAILSTLSLTLGARIDVHSTTEESISPRAAAVWECAEDQHLRLSAGRGFRNPSVRELWFDMPLTGLMTPATVRGNRDLDPERLTSYEAGYFGSWGRDATPAPGGSVHRFEAGVSTFYNRIDDLSSFEVTPGNPAIVAPRNQPGEEAYGVELEGRHVFSDWFSTFGNYAWLRRRVRATNARNLFAPEHKANLGVTFSGNRSEAMLWANYYAETKLGDRPVDEYVLLNGSLSYRFELHDAATGRLFVRAFNLLDDDHREHPEGYAYGLLLSAGMQFDW